MSDEHAGELSGAHGMTRPTLENRAGVKTLKLDVSKDEWWLVVWLAQYQRPPGSIDSYFRTALREHHAKVLGELIARGVKLPPHVIAKWDSVKNGGS